MNYDWQKRDGVAAERVHRQEARKKVLTRTIAHKLLNLKDAFFRMGTEMGRIRWWGAGREN